MLAQGSTHSCCKDNNQISCSLTPLPVSVSPTSLDTLLNEVSTLDAVTLQRILGGAVSTIHQTQKAHICKHQEKIHLLENGLKALKTAFEHFKSSQAI